MRVIGFLFLVLTFLVGITLGTIEIALINVIVFLALSLMVLWLFEKRLGNRSIVFSLFAIFLMSFSWPLAAVAAFGDLGANCEPTGKPDGSCTVLLEPMSKEPQG